MTKSKREFRAGGGYDPPPLRVVVQFQDSSTLALELHGELDMATAPILADHLESFAGLPPGDDQRLVYDLSNVSFIDATGLKALVSPGEVPRPDTVTIRDPSPPVRRLLGIVGLESMIDDGERGMNP